MEKQYIYIYIYGKSSNKRSPSFKRFSPISAAPKIRRSLWTPPSFRRPLVINDHHPSPRRVFIRKMVTYLFKPILSVGSRNQPEIIIYRSNCCYFLWKSITSGQIHVTSLQLYFFYSCFTQKGTITKFLLR